MFPVDRLLTGERLERGAAGETFADGIDPDLARSLAEHLSDEMKQCVATKDHVDIVVSREVQGLRVEMTQQLQSLRVELSDKLTMQFRWLLGWLAVVTVGILLDLLH